MNRVLRWLREPIQPSRPTCPWPGFYEASRAYMMDTPRWRFLLSLPRAALRFYYYTWRDKSWDT